MDHTIGQFANFFKLISLFVSVCMFQVILGSSTRGDVMVLPEKTVHMLG